MHPLVMCETGIWERCFDISYFMEIVFILIILIMLLLYIYRMYYIVIISNSMVSYFIVNRIGSVSRWRVSGQAETLEQRYSWLYKVH